MTGEVIEPHGFCGGVERAIKIAKTALSDVSPVYCLHEIVHNETVVRELAADGMRFVDAVDEVPDGAVMLISAHGTSPAVRSAAEARSIRIIDATCPFVAAAHAAIRANAAKGMRTVVVGDPEHVEVLGYLGETGACREEDLKPGESAGRVVQTTLPVQPSAADDSSPCTATRDRQQAVRDFMLAHAEGGVSVGVLVIGSASSANTGRLAEIAERSGAKAFRVSSPEDVSGIEFAGISVLGVTSGASTPESLFLQVLHSVTSRSPKS